MNYKEKIKNNPSLKRIALRLLMHPVKARPNFWIRLFRWSYTERGKGSVIYRSVRADLVPYNRFSLGKCSVIEDFCCLNNAMGDVTVGDYSRIGLHSTVIGKVTIGNHVHTAQGVVISALNHNFENAQTLIDAQGVNIREVVIEDDVWIGANAVILQGVTIGCHSVVAAGSIVTRNIPPYSVCAGNPARIVKRYDAASNTWIKPEAQS